jgi:hypothetical protein
MFPLPNFTSKTKNIKFLYNILIITIDNTMSDTLLLEIPYPPVRETAGAMVDGNFD